MSIANEILNQLGGRRFMAMTGAKSMMDGGNYLSFRLPSTPHFVKNGINCVKITLTAMDDYLVEFLKIRGVKATPIAQAERVYNDNLRDVFEANTGLATSL